MYNGFDRIRNTVRLGEGRNLNVATAGTVPYRKSYLSLKGPDNLAGAYVQTVEPRVVAAHIDPLPSLLAGRAALHSIGQP
jgi:hypothetical protein